MKTAWSKELCSSKPEQFEKLNAETWIQRKDIQRAPKKDDVPDPGYTCMSRMISNDVYEALMEEYEGPTYQTLLDQQEAADVANAEILLQQTEIQATQSDQDEVLAEILLNTMTEVL